MTDEVDPTALIGVMSTLLDVAIPAEWQADIAAHLKANAAAAALVLEQALPDEVEAASVFTA